MGRHLLCDVGFVPHFWTGGKILRRGDHQRESKRKAPNSFSLPLRKTAIENQMKRKDLHRKWMMLLVGLVAFGYVFMPLTTDYSRRTMSVSHKNNHTYPTELPCRETLNATIHDRRANVRERYENRCRAKSGHMNRPMSLQGKAYDVPELKVLRGTKIEYIIWKHAPFPEASAWTEDEEIEGKMFVTPKDKIAVQNFANLTGDFVVSSLYPLVECCPLGHCISLFARPCHSAELH